jgi:hypothetical protein
VSGVFCDGRPKPQNGSCSRKNGREYA